MVVLTASAYRLLQCQPSVAEVSELNSSLSFQSYTSDRGQLRNLDDFAAEFRELARGIW